MSDPHRAFEQAEEQLHQDLLDGRISNADYAAEMRELGRDYRDYAEEAARDAYDAEMENW